MTIYTKQGLLLLRNHAGESCCWTTGNTFVGKPIMLNRRNSTNKQQTNKQKRGAYPTMEQNWNGRELGHETKSSPSSLPACLMQAPSVGRTLPYYKPSIGHNLLVGRGTQILETLRETKQRVSKCNEDNRSRSWLLSTCTYNGRTLCAIMEEESQVLGWDIYMWVKPQLLEIMLLCPLTLVSWL